MEGRGGKWGAPPVIVAEARPPVGGPEQRLHGAGQIHKHVAHQEEPGTVKGPGETGQRGGSRGGSTGGGEERDWGETQVRAALRMRV